MNELYEFMEQVDVIVTFCQFYGLNINGIVWIVCKIISFIVKMIKTFREKHKQKNATQNEDVTE